MGVLTFGAEAQTLFSALPAEKQDAAYLEAAEAIADRMNTTLAGLVVHADESAPHAHLMFPAFDLDGQPLTRTMKKGALVEFQDILAEVRPRRPNAPAPKPRRTGRGHKPRRSSSRPKRTARRRRRNGRRPRQRTQRSRRCGAGCSDS